MRDPIVRRLIHRATVERRVETNEIDTAGHPVRALQVIHQDLACLAYAGENAGLTLDGQKTAAQTGYRMMTAFGTDIDEEDIVTRLVDRTGADILPGPGRVRVLNVRTWGGMRPQRHKFRMSDLERTH